MQPKCGCVCIFIQVQGLFTSIITFVILKSILLFAHGKKWALFCFPEAGPSVWHAAPGLQQSDRGHALGPQASGDLLPGSLLWAGEPPVRSADCPKSFKKKTKTKTKRTIIKLYLINSLFSVIANLMNLSYLVWFLSSSVVNFRFFSFFLSFLYYFLKAAVSSSSLRHS